MEKIFIAGEIPAAGYEALKEYELDVYKGEKLIGEEELLIRSRDADAILSLLSTPVNKKIIDSAEKIKIVANFGAGFDNVDYEFPCDLQYLLDRGWSKAETNTKTLYNNNFKTIKL